MGLSDTAIGTYRPQYRPLSAIRYLDANPLPTCYTLFITLGLSPNLPLFYNCQKWICMTTLSLFCAYDNLEM
jgi:hypothetical protein